MNMTKKSQSKIRRIVIDTPCSVTDVEKFLHVVSHEGHWHDSVVKGKDNKIIIEYYAD